MLDDVSLEVNANEIVCVTGDSGAGKTVLLRAIADLDPNQAEDVVCNGQHRSMVPAPEWRRMVGYLAAEPGWWHARVGDHYDDIAAARHLAVRLGVDPAAFDRPVALASTGERQRLALIRALLRRPQALLLDEPTSALDTSSKTVVEALLREVSAAGTAIVLVSHDSGQARRLGARLFELRDGRLSSCTQATGARATRPEAPHA